MQEDLSESLTGMKILVVDDHEDNLDLLLALLEDRDYTDLITAENGKVALDILFGEAEVDLVLLDINMPVMNGYEVLERMKGDENLQHIPVIMVTALDQLSSVIRCIEGGAEDYLTKPVEETLLGARVQASLERKYLRDKERELLRQVQEERAKSDALLYNVLPESVAERLKRGEENIAGPYLINLTEPLCEAGHVSHGLKSDAVAGENLDTIDPQSRDRNNQMRGSDGHSGDILFDQILIPARILETYVSDSAKVFDHAVAAKGNNRNRASDHVPVFADFIFEAGEDATEEAEELRQHDSKS